MNAIPDTADTWLDLTPSAAPSADLACSTSKTLEVPSSTAPEDEWMNIEDPTKGEVSAPFRHLVDSCMRGTNRVMACDGKWLAYRPFNREFDKETNPRTKERVAMFLEKGFYRHAGTYDEVQIYELLEGNPYLQKRDYVVGQDYWADIRKCARAAVNREWADYHDLLGGMATALKTGRDPLFAKTIWDDTINQIAIAVKQIGGDQAPTEKEVNEGFIGIRKARGIPTRGHGIVTLDSNKLQKVGFEARK